MKTSRLALVLLTVSLISLIVSSSAFAKKSGKPGDGGGGTDTGHVSMLATGIVDAFQDCSERLAADDTSYLCNKSGVEHYISLGDFLMDRDYANGSSETCFGAGYFPVTIGVAVNRDASAETVLRFHGYENDGETDVLYVLVVTDPYGWSGSFPPEIGDTATMGELQGQNISWALSTSNKRQARDACVDSGTFGNGSDFIYQEKCF